MKDKSTQSKSDLIDSGKNQKKQGILDMLQKSSLKKGVDLLVSRVTGPCSKYDEGACMDYLDLTMGEKKKKEFDAHFPDCPACLLNLLKVIEADEKASSNHILGKSFQTISVTRALERLGIRHEGYSEEEEPFLLAASPEIKGLKDSASGIGVSLDTGRGQIIECIAYVSEEKDREGSLHVFGSQVEEKEVEGKRIKVTPPLEMIQEVLTTLFKSQEYFASHRCSSRDITIQVSHEKEGYLVEGLSLSLAAAAAVYLALTGRTLSKEVVFSGNLEITGKIRKVSHLDLKAKVSQTSGKRLMILPQGNREDIRGLSEEEAGDLQFRFFDTLGQVFHCLEEISPKKVDPTQRKEPVTAETVPEEPTPNVNSVTPVRIYIDARQHITVKGINLKDDMKLKARGLQFELKKSSPGCLVFKIKADENTQEGKTTAIFLWQGREIYSFEIELTYGLYIDTLFRLDLYPVRASITVTAFVLLLCSGKYFYLSDFLLALSLKPSFPTRFYDMLHVIALSLFTGNIIFAFIKHRTHHPMRSVLFYFLFFALISLSLFTTAPYVYDDVDIYNKIIYHIKKPGFKKLFSDVPNFPLLNFKKYQEAGDAEGAYRAAQRVKDLKDYIREVYIPLTGLFEQKEYQNRQAAIESTKHFLQGVDQHYTDQSLRRKILRGLQAANWIAQSFGDEGLMQKIKLSQKMVSGR